MPSNLILTDSQFPVMEENESPKEQNRKILNYLYMLVEQLRYTLANLGVENINPSEIETLTEIINKPLVVKVKDTEGKISELSIGIDGIKSSVQNNEENIASITQDVDANTSFIKLIAIAGGLNSPADADKDTNMASIYLAAINGQNGESESIIRLNADKISFGNYAGVDKSGNFYAKRLFGDSGENYTVDEKYYPGFFFAEINSNYKLNGEAGADFFIKPISSFGLDNFSNSDIIYGFAFDKTSTNAGESVNFMVGELYGNDNADPDIAESDGERAVWGYNYKQKKLYPKGVWDFSSCKVKNLGVVPVFG